MTLRSPYPYFGGKSAVAALVWERFGGVLNYVEPFFGSGAMLLARPGKAGTETVNDAHAFIPNFWRAVQSAPDEVAHYADWPVSECDLHARHLWLANEGLQHVARCKTEPNFFDAKIAGWWVWGACQWIGSGWCAPSAKGNLKEQVPFLTGNMGIHKPHQKIPHVETCGMGIHKPSHQLPHLADAGRGQHRPSQKMPELASDRGTRSEKASDLYRYMEALSARLRRVRVCCGDWSRVVGPSVTFRHGMTGVFLDPPYDLGEREAVYAVESAVGGDVRAWCLENGPNPLLRIALCGYAGEGHEPLESAGWTPVHWKARGGYGSQGEGRGRENARRETIWFSPHCLKAGLFEEAL